MRIQQGRWLVWGLCLVLASCGVSGASKSERIAEAQAELALPPQISPDFPVDHAVPGLDPNATLMSVAASKTGGYLLTYGVVHTPEGWSPAVLGPGYVAPRSSELVFVHWDALSGAPTTLARFLTGRLADQGTGSARAVDVGNGWLVAYEEVNGIGTMRHARTLARDGSLGSPQDLPAGACAFALQGFVRGGSTALLTDDCGGGLLLDFTGAVLASLSIATPTSFVSPPTAGRVYGGSVAFNGIDYLSTYYFNPDAFTSYAGRQALGFPITEAGVVAPPIVIANPRVQDGHSSTAPTDVVANGSAFLTVLSQGRSFNSGRDYSYRIATEAPDHTFTFGAERYLPGELNPNPGAASNRAVRALTLGGRFVVARLPPTGSLQLIYPSSDPALPDVSQPLAGTLPDGDAPTSTLPLVSTDSQNSDGTRLLFASNAKGVRFDDTLHLIDNPPAVLLTSLHGQFMPSFAYAEPHFLATWAEGVPDGLGYPKGNAAQIFAQHLSTTGAIVDSASQRLSPALQSQMDPRVIANPSWFAAVWGNTNGGGVTLTATDPPQPFLEPTTVSHGWNIATDGVHLVMAFDNYIDISLRQLESAGTWSNGVTVAAGYADPTGPAPSVAFNAGKYAVLWTVAGDPGERIIYGARLSSDLVLLDAPPKELVHFSSPDVPGYVGHPADCGLELIASGDRFLLAWAQVTGSVEELRIARLSGTLAVLDPGGVLVSTQPFPPPVLTPRRVALGWDGGYDWVVWIDGEGGTRRPFVSLRGRRFSDTLAPAEAAPFLISSDLLETSMATLSVGAGGSSLVGYTRYALSDQSYRVQARFLSSVPFAEGVPCSSAEQCDGGFCVAGSCSTVSGAGGSGGTGGGSPGSAGTAGSVAAGGDTSGGIAGGVATGGSTGGSGGTGGGSPGSGGTAGDVAGGDTGGGIAGGTATDGSTGGTATGGTAGGTAIGGSTGGSGGAGDLSVGGDTGGGLTAGGAMGASTGGSESAGNGQLGEAGSMSSAGEGGSESESGGEATGGTSAGGMTGVSGASPGHAGVAGTKTGGGGSNGHSCSIRVAPARSTSEDLVSLAGVATALCWLRRRRQRSAA